MSIASKDDVPQFPAVFVLENSQIHVGSTNYSNIATNIEVSVY